MISTIILIGCFGMAAWAGWLLYKHEMAESAARHLASSDLRSIIQKKDERIAAMDADYKALVESYLRETGKVYVRPVMTAGEQFKPAEPNPFRFKPPPPWAPYAPRVASAKVGK